MSIIGGDKSCVIPNLRIAYITVHYSSFPCKIVKTNVFLYIQNSPE